MSQSFDSVFMDMEGDNILCAGSVFELGAALLRLLCKPGTKVMFVSSPI